MTLVYDDGPRAGLGHRSRIAAVAAALAGRGHDVDIGATADTPVVDGQVAVIDSYERRADDRTWVRSPAVIALDDLARDLDVAVLVDPSPGADGSNHRRAGLVLAGERYALLSPATAAATPRPIGDRVESVLVTFGGADSSGHGEVVAGALRSALPGTDLVLVRGPWSAAGAPDGVHLVSVRDGLGDVLAQTDLVVTASGVTLLEALHLGRPIVCTVIAENQRQAASAAEAAGAAVLADLAGAADAAVALAADPDRRRALGSRAAALVDGRGAVRVADVVARLADAR